MTSSDPFDQQIQQVEALLDQNHDCLTRVESTTESWSQQKDWIQNEILPVLKTCQQDVSRTLAPLQESKRSIRGKIDPELEKVENVAKTAKTHPQVLLYYTDILTLKGSVLFVKTRILVQAKLVYIFWGMVILLLIIFREQLASILLELLKTP